MFCVFSSPIQFTKSYTEACQIADAHYNKTGEVVAVEGVTNHTPFYAPSVSLVGA